MNELYEQLNNELKSLKVKEKYLSERCKNAPKHRVVVRNNGGHPSYYIVDDENKERYVPKDSHGEVMKILQIGYEANVLKMIEKRIHAIQCFKKAYSKYSPQDFYEKLSPGKKAMIDPVFETEKEFVQRWTKNNRAFTQPNSIGIPTKSGFIVRSKSEKIIADALFDNNLTFVVEKQLNIKSEYFYSVDFAICDAKNRRTIYWEHFGLMDKPDYKEKNIKKILSYINGGLVPGVNFIWTKECKNNYVYDQINENIKWIKNGGKWNIVDLFDGTVNSDLIVSAGSV